MAAKTESKGAEAFETLTAINPAAFKESYEKFAENLSALAEFQKGSLDAVMKSAGLFAKGVEKVSTEQTAFAKSAFEDSVAAAKAASSSKSVQEALELNSDFVRDTVENNLGQFNKIADIWVETTKTAAEPLTTRYSELVEKIQSYRP